MKKITLILITIFCININSQAVECRRDTVINYTYIAGTAVKNKTGRFIYAYDAKDNTTEQMGAAQVCLLA